MSENLKTLRLLHNLLILTATAVLAFALTPDQSDKYKAALGELATLRELDRSDYVSYAHSRLPASDNELSKQLLSEVRKAGIPIIYHPSFIAPYFGDMFDEPPDLKGYEGFFTSMHNIAPVDLNFEDGDVTKYLKTRLIGRFEGASLTDITFTSPIGLRQNGIIVLRWPGSPTPTAGNLEFGLRLKPPVQDPDAVFTTEPITMPIHISVGPTDKQTFALDWLRQDPIGKQLIDPRSGSVLPRLKVFWSQINVMRPEDADSFLKRGLDSLKEGSISFFGISVASSLVVWVGPIITLFLMLSFAMTLAHFRAIADQTDGAVASYPWIPLFPGVLAGTLGYASFLYPALCSGYLLYKYGDFADLNTKIGWSVTLVLVVTAAYAIRDLIVLRKRIRFRAA